MTAREELLDRVRRASAAPRYDVDAVRSYRRVDEQPWAIDQLIDVLADRLGDYNAGVVRCAAGGVPTALTAILNRQNAHDVVIPGGFPSEWLPGDVKLRRDTPTLTREQLDEAGGVLTTSRVAIAETGTIVLDAGPGMGRRALTLVPDLHIVVVRMEDVVRGVPEALARLEPTRPLTWISGPSATSDIELNRVEGVHGPRRLEVLVAGLPERLTSADAFQGRPVP